MFRPSRRPSSGLQISKRINIVCVWRMLRYHQASKLHMRQNLRVGRQGGGYAYVVSWTGVSPLGHCIVGVREGVRMAISRSIRFTSVGKR